MRQMVGGLELSKLQFNLWQRQRRRLSPSTSTSSSAVSVCTSEWAEIQASPGDVSLRKQGGLGWCKGGELESEPALRSPAVRGDSRQTPRPTPEDSREIGAHRTGPTVTAAPARSKPQPKPTPDDVIVAGGGAPKMAAGNELC